MPNHITTRSLLHCPVLQGHLKSRDREGGKQSKPKSFAIPSSSEQAAVSLNPAFITLKFQPQH